MNTAVKVTTCVDCATPIIGERLFCPACYQRHAALLIVTPIDDDVTAPWSRRESDAAASLLARWVVAIEVITIVVLALVLVARGCSS